MDDLRKKSVLQTDFMGGGGVGNSWGKIYLSCRLMLENNVEGFYLARFGKNPYPNQITHTLPPPPTPPLQKSNGRPLNIPFATSLVWRR